jgi:hypothetical protein
MYANADILTLRGFRQSKIVLINPPFTMPAETLGASPLSTPKNVGVPSL